MVTNCEALHSKRTVIAVLAGDWDLFERNFIGRGSNVVTPCSLDGVTAGILWMEAGVEKERRFISHRVEGRGSNLFGNSLLEELKEHIFGIATVEEAVPKILETLANVGRLRTKGINAVDGTIDKSCQDARGVS